MSKARTVGTILCLLLVVAIASPAIGDEEVTITRGRVMFATNDTVIVQIIEGSHPGNHKFSIKDAEAEDVTFTDRMGNQIEFSDMRRGQEITAVRVHHDAMARVEMTQTEVDEFIAGNVVGVDEESVTEEIVYEDGVAVDEEVATEDEVVEEDMVEDVIEETVVEEIVELPSTASWLPLVGLAALLFLGLAATMAGLRRVLQ